MNELITFDWINQRLAMGPTGQEYYRSSGRYYGGNITGSLTTMALVANVVRAWPFIVTKQITISEIKAEVTTAVAASTFRIGIYSSNASNYPDALIANSDTGTLDSAAIGVKTGVFAANITLKPGLYWFVFNSNGGATLRAISATSVIGVLGFKATMGAQAPAVGLTVAFTYAAMPATYPAGATDLDTTASPQLAIVKIV